MSDTVYFKCGVDGEYIDIPPIEKLCKALQIKFKDQEEEVERWKKKYEELRNSDKEYIRLKKDAEEARRMLYNGFGITDEEDKKIDEWIDNHRKNNKGTHFFSYVFTPTSLGTTGEIKCKCGESFQFRELL